MSFGAIHCEENRQGCAAKRHALALFYQNETRIILFRAWSAGQADMSHVEYTLFPPEVQSG
jgi:hypothetical protein